MPGSVERGFEPLSPASCAALSALACVDCALASSPGGRSTSGSAVARVDVEACGVALSAPAAAACKPSASQPSSPGLTALCSGQLLLRVAVRGAAAAATAATLAAVSGLSRDMQRRRGCRGCWRGRVKRVFCGSLVLRICFLSGATCIPGDPYCRTSKRRQMELHGRFQGRGAAASIALGLDDSGVGSRDDSDGECDVDAG